MKRVSLSHVGNEIDVQSPGGFRSGREAKKKKEEKKREGGRKGDGRRGRERSSDPCKFGRTRSRALGAPGANFTPRRTRSDGQVSAGRNYIKRGKERHRGREGPEER